ncbi:MAG: hypothetical protein J5982_03205 [Bacilli bacterium]|nr:hypothetical protein [Bacilli bacterium]
MSYYNDNYSIARKRFYSIYKNFNGFRDINEDVIKRIDELIQKYKNTHIEETSFYLRNFKSREYMNLLNYLYYKKDLTYDEKVLFIIRYFDPELKLLNLYFESDTTDREDIEKEENDFIRNSQLDANLEFSSKCHEIIGISDPYIVKYELVFFKRCLSKELKFNIKKDFINKFFRTYPIEKVNLSISDEELETIIQNARDYKKKYGVPSFNDLLFQLSEQKSIINISGKSIKELFIFMMYVLDEEFRALHIYNEYCKWDLISAECRRELGFYNKNFIESERRFAEDNPDNPINLTLF